MIEKTERLCSMFRVNVLGIFWYPDSGDEEEKGERKKTCKEKKMMAARLIILPPATGLLSQEKREERKNREDKLSSFHEKRTAAILLLMFYYYHFVHSANLFFLHFSACCEALENESESCRLCSLARTRRGRTAPCLLFSSPNSRKRGAPFHAAHTHARTLIQPGQTNRHE